MFSGMSILGLTVLEGTYLRKPMFVLLLGKFFLVVFRELLYFIMGKYFNKGSRATSVPDLKW